MRQFESAHREHLRPQQLGVGVSGGIGILVFGLRLLMELCPHFVYVSLDKRNAHNEFCRDACLAEYGSIPELCSLVPFLFSMLVIRARVQAGDSQLDARSECGGAQGAPCGAGAPPWSLGSRPAGPGDCSTHPVTREVQRACRSRTDPRADTEVWYRGQTDTSREIWPAT